MPSILRGRRWIQSSKTLHCTACHSMFRALRRSARYMAGDLTAGCDREMWSAYRVSAGKRLDAVSDTRAIHRKFVGSAREGTECCYSPSVLQTPRAARFYDQALKPLGLVRKRTAIAINMRRKILTESTVSFWVVRPHDKGDASPATGNCCLNAKSRGIDAFTERRCRGGTDMGRAGLRTLSSWTITAPMCATTATKFAVCRPGQTG